jgi:hypothetical protein
VIFESLFETLRAQLAPLNFCGTSVLKPERT